MSRNAMDKAKAALAEKRGEVTPAAADAARRDVPPGIEVTELPQTLYRKLLAVQSKLCAPKSKFNKFGGYAYRSAEDILTAVKPLLRDVGAVITITDTLHETPQGAYIEAKAAFFDVDGDGCISVRAYAREPETKKGMDVSQITGCASSYARKYALNGLLLIDDNTDADALPPPQTQSEPANPAADF